MSHAFPIDPFEVLGVTPRATLEELREAYRAKSKKHHPDAGGDEWAFRVVTRSYEIVCTARVMGRADEELARDAGTARAAARPAAESNPFGKVDPKAAMRREGAARTGIQDSGLPPERLVAVDLLLLRHEMDPTLGLLLESPEDRNLSCTLNIGWPGPEVDPAIAAPATGLVLAALADAFRAVVAKSRPNGSRSGGESGRFTGWLSYASAARADDAFKLLHAALRERGLGVIQTIREITIPRDWR